MYSGVLACLRLWTANAIRLVSEAVLCMLMFIFNFFETVALICMLKNSVLWFFFRVKYCPNIYCPYCRQAVWHLNHPPLTSLIWFPFLPYPLNHQHLLAMVHSLLQYPVDLQRSVSFMTTDLIFSYILFIFLIKLLKRFAYILLEKPGMFFL